MNKASPLKRIYIEKKGKKKKRPLGIPTMYDRAIQALYAMALDPIAETTADNVSFGFRRKRSAHDAAQHIFNYSAKNGKHTHRQTDTQTTTQSRIYLQKGIIPHSNRNPSRRNTVTHHGKYHSGRNRKENQRKILDNTKRND